VEGFKGRQISVVNETRSGWPSNVTCVEVKEQKDQRIRDRRTITIYETASKISISHGKEWLNSS
jgi:hypothetical protein